MSRRDRRTEREQLAAALLTLSRAIDRLSTAELAQVQRAEDAAARAERAAAMIVNMLRPDPQIRTWGRWTPGARGNPGHYAP